MMRLLLVLSACAVAGVFATGAGAGGQGAARGSFPFDEVVFVPCANGGAGEFVELSGSLNFVFHDIFDASGGLHVQVHSNLQGVSGMGATTGTRYRGVESDVDQFNVSPDDAPFESSTVSSVRVIGRGPGNNFVLHESAHFTVNGNGELTASHDHLGVDCK
jgi:hypothetical protein